MELSLLSKKLIPRCCFTKCVTVVSVQLHGFCDASEDAYVGVIYLRTVDSTHAIHTSLVSSKTRVFPIKRLTIPHLELCGAHLYSTMLRKCFTWHIVTSSLGSIAPSCSTGLLAIPVGLILMLAIECRISWSFYLPIAGTM